MLIGITGGIGSGKSVVSRILRLKGYEVYDCDSEAKKIMDESREIKCRIRDEISGSVTDGVAPPDRKLLAGIVFNDEAARKKLNEIVHKAVREDVGKRSGRIMWVESAILAESGLSEMCARIWLVETPKEKRIANILKRDRTTAEQAESRIRSQQEEERLLKPYAAKTDIILNGGEESVLAQITVLLGGITNEDY